MQIRLFYDRILSRYVNKQEPSHGRTSITLQNTIYSVRKLSTSGEVFGYSTEKFRMLLLDMPDRDLTADGMLAVDNADFVRWLHEYQNSERL